MNIELCSSGGYGCFFADKKLIINRLTFSLPDNVPKTLLDIKNMTLTDGITFNPGTIKCWCGCGNQDLKISILRKGLTKKKKVSSFVISKNKTESDSDGDSDGDGDTSDSNNYYTYNTSNSDTDSDSEADDTDEKYILDNVPVDDIVEKLSDVECDTHWDCYCKWRRVCGCGCDKKHDG